MERYSLLLVKHKTGYAEPESILRFKGFEVIERNISGSNISAFVDKIENDTAELILDNEQVVFIDLEYLPKYVKEGSYLSIEFTFDENKTIKIKNDIKNLIDELSGNSQA